MMNNNFLLLKLNRAIWVSYLEQKKIMDAANYYELYRNALLGFKAESESEKHDLAMEILFAQGMFLGKIRKIADEFFNKNDYAQATICYAAFYKYEQKNVDVLRNYIKCLDKLEQYDLEIDMLKYLSEIVDDDNDLLKFLAEAYSNKKDYAKAVEYYEKYLKSKNDISADEYNLLGCYYNSLYSDVSHNTEDAIKSLEYFEKASDMVPSSHLFAKNATIMAGKSNDYQKGRKFWDRLFEINNFTNDDKYDYAAFCLKTQDFEGWHKYFGARFDKENNATQFPKISKPCWNGVKDLSESTLLVRFEQGYGDSFLMYGYLPRLTKLAKHVIFVVQNSIYPLLKNNDYGIEVLPESTDLSNIKFNYYIPSMSVPTVLKLTKQNISVGEGYIKADDRLIKEYKEKYFNNNKLKIGFSVSGSAVGDKSRDISIKELLPFDKLDNVELYCLTKGINDTDLDCFKSNKIHNIAKSFGNFADTAAAMENCDLIVSSDNVLLNLAGALGKKTYGLFNWENQFRWFDLSGENVIWFTSVKPFVNDKQGNWKYSINNVINEIKNN